MDKDNIIKFPDKEDLIDFTDPQTAYEETFKNMLTLIKEQGKVIHELKKYQDVMLEYVRNNTDHIHGIYGEIETIGKDLMEYQIYVGEFNLDYFMDEED